MHLHEEYIGRHKLEVPLIRYDSRSVVLLRSKEEPTYWRLIDISWSPCHWHPGKFIVRHLAPQHDHSRMTRVKMADEVYWDQYEDRMLSFRELRKDFHAIPKKDKSLPAWYVFLYMHDTFLSRLSFGFRDLVATSIDAESELLTRRMAAKKAQLLMCREDQGLKDIFESYLLTYRHYADWLVNLING